MKISEFESSKELLKANVVDSKREKLWKECVAEAKLLTRQYEEVRFRVVELALKCCVITSGGRKSNALWSTASFAKDIGMHPKTLNEWIRIKRSVFDKLDAETQKTVKFEELTKLDRKLAGSNRESPEYENSVQKKLRELRATHPNQLRLLKYLAVMKTVKYNSEHAELLEGCNAETVGEIVSLCRTIINNLKNYDHNSIKVIS